MTPLSDQLCAYLDHRRRFGADMTSVGLVLKPFVAFAEEEGAEWVTTDLFLRWKDTFGSAGSNTWSTRLSVLRCFAVWLQGLDDRHEVPPRGLAPRRGTRPQPWIYSEAEIERIVVTAAALPSPSGLRGATCSTLFGLIAVTGLRVSEALGLDDRDVDADDAILAVRHAKNGKSRVIPVTRCVIAKLKAYQHLRDHVVTPAGSDALFRAENGNRARAQIMERSFAKVGLIMGLRQPSPARGRRPRIHDLRHSFASRTILEWFRQGRDVDAEMYKLSAYLGHKNPAGTWWYIEAVPELLALASERGLRTLGDGGVS